MSENLKPWIRKLASKPQGWIVEFLYDQRVQTTIRVERADDPLDALYQATEEYRSRTTPDFDALKLECTMVAVIISGFRVPPVERTVGDL